MHDAQVGLPIRPSSKIRGKDADARALDGGSMGVRFVPIFWLRVSGLLMMWRCCGDGTNMSRPPVAPSDCFDSGGLSCTPIG